ncbi:MAG: ABC transporter substrate-binding protein [Oligoflexia bacterium]|nr:ABC transporter substrate-binding protein [Oligoflexia bacterium]
MKRGKALVLLALVFCPSASGNTAQPLKILLDQAPATLNPRSTLDAAGQRIAALMFRALSRIDADLVPQPDLAQDWQITEAGRTWTFRIRENLQDHQGQLITPGRIAACLENYRTGKPISPLRGTFPHWIGTSAAASTVTLKLSRPDPYLARNVSLLRYFTTGNPDQPCEEPGPRSPVIASGLYRAASWDLAPQGRFLLLPTALAGGRRAVEFSFVLDDNSKALKLIRGEVDAVQNAISLTKTRWISDAYADRFSRLEREGVSVSYLAFNLRHPILGQKDVRHAIALAIDRERIIRHKHIGFTSLAGSLLSPLLPESRQVSFAYDPAKAEALLDRAGFPRDKSGVRLSFHFKSTPVRDGIETALLFQEMLRKIGVKLVIDVVEPAVFFASIRKGNFQLYASRWLGVADGSILYNTLHTGQPQNRIGYSNPRMDQLLEAAAGEPRLERRLPLLVQVQDLMGEELPYLPLWYWGNVLIYRKELGGLEARELSLSGALEPLTRLR